MNFQIEPYQLFLIIAAIIGAIWTVGKAFGAQIEKNLEDKFIGITAAQNDAKTANENALRVERQVLELKAHLPLHYVRRDDFIRGQSVIEAKLDALASKLEVVQIQGAAK